MIRCCLPPQVTEASIELKVGENYNLKIQFDPSYIDDQHIRTKDEILSISYNEHPHVVCYVSFLIEMQER